MNSKRSVSLSDFVLDKILLNGKWILCEKFKELKAAISAYCNASFEDSSMPDR